VLATRGRVLTNPVYTLHDDTGERLVKGRREKEEKTGGKQRDQREGDPTISEGANHEKTTEKRGQQEDGSKGSSYERLGE